MATELKELVASGISETIQIFNAIRSDNKIVSKIGKIAAICIEAVGIPGDVLIAISTPGQSPSIRKGIETAHKKRYASGRFYRSQWYRDGGLV